MCFLHSKLLLLLLVPCSLSFSLPIFSQPTWNIFKEEALTGAALQLLICGNQSQFSASSYSSVKLFANKFQIAFRPENWILDNTTELDLLSSSFTGSALSSSPSIIFLIPSSLEKLSLVINLLSTHLHGLQKGSSRVIYLVSWPHQIQLHQANLVRLENEIKTTVMEATTTTSSSSLRLTDEIYVLLWSVGGSEISLSSPSTSLAFLLDQVEVFGVMEMVPPVVRSLELLSTYTTPVRHIHTTELVRWAFRRSDMHGMPIRAVAQPDANYEAEVTITDVDGNVTFVSGSSYNLLMDFQLMLNFTHVAVNGSGWVSAGENGSCLSGMGQQVVDGEADLCISTSTVEDYRAACVSFLQPTLTEESFIFFRQPSVTSARNIFMMPFTLGLWITYLGAWFVVAGCGGLVAFRKGATFRHASTAHLFSRYARAAEEYTWLESVIWSIGVYCNQGWFQNPLTVSIRIVFASALMLSLVVYNYYTAAFVAAASTPTVAIQSYKDFKAFDYKIITDPSVQASIGSFAPDEKEEKQILANSRRYYSGDTDAVERVMEDEFAFIIGSDGFYAVGFESYNVKELCQVEAFRGKTGARLKDAWFIRKGKDYFELFRYRGVVAIERGLNSRYLATYNQETQVKCLPNVNNVIELKFLECYSAFVILVLGALLALAALVFENHQNLLFTACIGLKERVLERKRNLKRPQRHRNSFDEQPTFVVEHGLVFLE